MQQDSSWVDQASWLSVIPFWLEAYYIFFNSINFFWLSSSSHFPQQQVIAPQKPQEDASGSELSRMTGASSNDHPAETQQQHRHQLVHQDAANAATENMT